MFGLALCDPRIHLCFERSKRGVHFFHLTRGGLSALILAANGLQLLPHLSQFALLLRREGGDIALSQERFIPLQEVIEVSG